MRLARQYWMVLLLPLTGSMSRQWAPEAAVAIRVFQFQPQSIEIQAGTTVTWTNADQIEHTVTSGADTTADGGFGGMLAGQGTTFTHAFPQPGVYSYFCDRHHSMRGEIRVLSRKAGN